MCPEGNDAMGQAARPNYGNCFIPQISMSFLYMFSIQNYCKRDIILKQMPHHLSLLKTSNMLQCVACQQRQQSANFLQIRRSVKFRDWRPPS
jgi:hypothetical protein